MMKTTFAILAIAMSLGLVACDDKTKTTTTKTITTETGPQSRTILVPVTPVTPVEPASAPDSSTTTSSSKTVTK